MATRRHAHCDRRRVRHVDADSAVALARELTTTTAQGVGADPQIATGVRADSGTAVFSGTVDDSRWSISGTRNGSLCHRQHRRLHYQIGESRRRLDHRERGQRLLRLRGRRSSRNRRDSSTRTLRQHQHHSAPSTLRQRTMVRRLPPIRTRCRRGRSYRCQQKCSLFATSSTASISDQQSSTVSSLTGAIVVSFDVVIDEN